MRITFDLPHVFDAQSSSLDDAKALRVMLDALISVNLAFLHANTAPALYRSGVRYGRTVVWDSIPALYARGFGDCKSLSAARIAEIRHAGGEANPVFRWKRRPDGGKDFHILVMRPDGWEDPSRKLGMGSNENAPVKAY